MKRYNAAFCLFISSQLIGCQNEPSSNVTENSEPQSKKIGSATETSTPNGHKSISPSEKQVEHKQVNNIHHWSNAQVKYFDLEGGFYGIVTETGHKLLPGNLAKEMRQDGAIVELSGYFEEGIITFQQWGKPFKITSIKVVKKGNNTPKSEQ